MSILYFEPAERKGHHLLMAMYAHSGAGKTYSALLIAYGLAKKQAELEGRKTFKVALIDTENERGRIYANLVPHVYSSFTDPWSPERYIEALDDIEDANIDVAVIDSASHCWDDIGGVLELAESNGGKGLLKWQQPKGRHKKFVKKMLRTRAHLILCLRAKDKFEEREVTDEHGNKKKSIVNTGATPIQARDFVYDMTVMLQLRQSEDRKGGFYTIEKCPGELWGAFDETVQLGMETGEMIAEWVHGGTPVDRKHETLKRSGEDAANQGRAALESWYKSIKIKKDRDRILPYVQGNLASIADEADRVKAQPKQDDREDDPVRTSFQEQPRGDARGESIFNQSRPPYLDGALMRFAGMTSVAAITEHEDETVAEIRAGKFDGRYVDEVKAAASNRIDEIVAGG